MKFPESWLREHVTVDADRATLAATLTARHSPMAKIAHSACADACRMCASACMGQDDAIMKACVKACQECEEMCKAMVRGDIAGKR